MRWIPVTELLPEAEQQVLAYCRYGTTGGYICKAIYIPPETYREDSGFDWDWDVCNTYNEERDDYEIDPGWYERIHNWDEYGSVGINDKVTHWMPLPEAPEVDRNAYCSQCGQKIDWSEEDDDGAQEPEI